jgi:hypothetical protein
MRRLNTRFPTDSEIRQAKMADEIHRPPGPFAFVKHFQYRTVHIEVWQGNDDSALLGYEPWFFRCLNRPYAERIDWYKLGPSQSSEDAIALAKQAVDKFKSW